jgi:hypothetical protein
VRNFVSAKSHPGPVKGRDLTGLYALFLLGGGEGEKRYLCQDAPLSTEASFSVRDGESDFENKTGVATFGAATKYKDCQIFETFAFYRCLSSETNGFCHQHEIFLQISDGCRVGGRVDGHWHTG